MLFYRSFPGGMGASHIKQNSVKAEGLKRGFYGSVATLPMLAIPQSPLLYIPAGTPGNGAKNKIYF